MLCQFKKGTNIQGLYNKFAGKFLRVIPAKLSIADFKKKVITMKNAESYYECFPEEEFPDEKKITIEEFENMGIDELNKLPMGNYGTVKALQKKKKNTIFAEDMDEVLSKPVKIYYIWGQSGYGKTTMAMKMVKEWLKKYEPMKGMNMLTCVNGFWEGVGENAIAAIYDDFRDKNLSTEKFINFIDYNATNMNTKGSYEKNPYKLIIITSVQSPFELYAEAKESEKQWLRRMVKVHLKEQTTRTLVVPAPETFSFGKEKEYEYIEMAGSTVKLMNTRCKLVEMKDLEEKKPKSDDDIPSDMLEDLFPETKPESGMLGKKREKEKKDDSVDEDLLEMEQNKSDICLADLAENPDDSEDLK